MRIFLIWPGKNQETVNLVSGLKQSGHEIVYWTSAKEHEGKFPEIILHDHFDAWNGVPPKELAGVAFDPPGEELIKKLSGVESIIMTMMNKHFEGRCVDERKNYYYDLLGYWYGVLNKYKPEAIIFSAPPHPTFSYLIFELARLLNINTLMFDLAPVAGRMIWYNDFWQGNRALKEELIKNKNKNFSLADLSEDLRAYFKLQIDETKDATPYYLKHDRIKNNLVNKTILKQKILFKSLKDLTFFKKIFLYLKKLIIGNTQKEYARFCDPQPDLSKKFIYVPLHYQPECNTSPMGGAFVSQILMIKTLSAALPEGWRIYVKEHPVQWMAFGLNYTDSRYPDYYKEIARVKNVHLIPVETDTYYLVKQAQAVATVTGTAGWEAVLRGKPALIFGCAWYNDCPGVWQINDVLTCRQALEKISGGSLPDRQTTINYLKCFESSSVSSFVNDPTESQVTEQESTRNILAVIDKELKRFI